MPSRDVAADLESLTRELGAEVEFAIERFGARVAQVRLASGPPGVLLADHLEGDAPVLVYRVDDLASAVRELEERGVDTGPELGFPYGPVYSFRSGGRRVAVYELTRPEAAERLAGRRDF
jgi:hypothetical protein